MKKLFMRSFMFAAALLFALNVNGCILDAFDTLTQGFPISVDINMSGTLTSLSESTTVNLDDSDFYNDNQDKIKKIELLKIAYRTTEVVPQTLSGNITLTVKQPNNIVLFSKIISNATPNNYKDTPYELQLTQSEIQLVNAYLGILSNKTLIATVEVSGLPAGPKTLNAKIDVVFEMEYDL